MKKTLAIFAILFFLSSCTAQNENDRLFCKKLGFDKEDGKIYVTALLTSPGKSTPENGKDKMITKAADTPDQTIKMLEAEFDSILFKPLECIIFGKGLGKTDINEIMVLMANRVEFQLKCNVLFAPVAKEAIANKVGADENGKVSFSRFFRNMKGGTNDEKTGNP